MVTALLIFLFLMCSRASDFPVPSDCELGLGLGLGFSADKGGEEQESDINKAEKSPKHLHASQLESDLP